jgi:peroxiredoxin
MVLTPSTMLPLGTEAPYFALPDTRGAKVTLSDFDAAPVLVVMFICNHCPYVQHLRHGLAKIARDYRAQGVAFVGINSNDADQYPADSPPNMAAEAEQYGYEFPYLFDETQQVAKAYRAACTPDIYVFDDRRCLVYRGQFDGSRPGNNLPVTGSHLRAAIDTVLAGEAVSEDQIPSMGCNIKWKAGNEPDYFGA